ncbi:MAG: NAD(P)/FAD-dependent oxidoreductase [Candidatus Brocadiia bacterium]
MSAKILIVGGGFAGISAATELFNQKQNGADIDVVMVDKSHASIFAPLLPDLISGRIRSSSVMYPLRPFCRRLGFQFRQTCVRSISDNPPAIKTENNRIETDFLILSFGCETNYFGQDKWTQKTIGLKTVEEGHQIREKLLRRIEKWKSDKGTSSGNIVVVGGGYTGFEIAGQIVRLLRMASGPKIGNSNGAARVLIVEKAAKPLRNVSESVRNWAIALMQSLGIEVKTGTTIESIEDQNATLTDGESLDNPLVIWTPGVRPGPAAKSLDIPTTKGQRLKVESSLKLEGCDRIYAAGDLAGPTPAGRENPLRMSVQFSVLGGRHAAENIIRQICGEALQAFEPFDPGYVLPLAPGWGTGKILGKSFYGRLPYIFHYLLCVAKSWGWANRCQVAGDILQSPARVIRQ